jgi:hypothetical protein
MRRAEWLIPYSHGHQHALAQSLRLRRAVEGDDDEAFAAAVEDMLGFASGELAEHMAQEETELLPLAVSKRCVTDAEVVRMARDHVRVRALAARLRREPGDPTVARRLATLVHDHVRWEERHLFQSWQQRCEASGTDAAPGGDAERFEPLPILAAVSTDVVVYPPSSGEPGSVGMTLETMHATRLTLDPGVELPPVTVGLDVVLTVVGGSGTLRTGRGADGAFDATHPLAPGVVIGLPTGTRRAISAGPRGLSLVNSHRRRDESPIDDAVGDDAPGGDARE